MKPKKPYWEMNADELAEATKEFDKPFVKTTPLTPKMRAAWNRAKRGRGRPRVGEGATSVLVSIERGLLREADKVAKRKKLTRSELVARSLRMFIGGSANEPKRRKSA